MDKTDHMRSLSAAFEKSRAGTVSIDVARYQHFLDEADMTEAEKEDFLKALWSMIICFVDLGFSVEPLTPACGQPEKSAHESGKPARLAVDYEKVSESKTEDAARTPG